MRSRRRASRTSSEIPDRESVPVGSRRVQYLLTPLLLILTYLLALPANAYRASQPVPPFGVLLEYSWNCDLTSQLADGRLAGRDFIYTYGPLRQLLHSAGSYIGSGDLAARIRFDRCLVAAMAVAGVWWMLSTTGAPWLWRACLLLAWFTLDYDLHIKPLAAVLVAIGCSRNLMRDTVPNSSRLKRYVPFVAWGLAAPLGMLYAFDLGVFIGLILTALGAGVAIASMGIATPESARVRRRSLALLASVCIGGAAFVGTLQFVLGWRDYLPDSISIATGYVGKLAYPFQFLTFLCVVTAGVVAAATAITAVRRLRAQWRENRKRQPVDYQQLAVGLTSLLLLRYALTGSDPPHVVDAILPGLFWWSCFVPARLAAATDPGWQRTARWSLPLLLLAKLLLIPQAVWSSWEARYTAVFAHQSSQRLAMDEPTRRAVAAARLQPGDLLAVWPNESFIGQAADKRNPLYTLQSIMAVNSHLQQRVINRLNSAQLPPVLAMRAAEEFDSVTHIARAPELFRYLLEHYELSGPCEAEFFLLQRAARAHVWRSQNVHLPADGVACPVLSGDLLEFDLSRQGILGSDLLMLRVSSGGFRWSPLAKQGARLLIKITLDNGEHRNRHVPLPQDGGEHWIGVSYLNPADPLFVAAFSATGAVVSKERIRRVDIAWRPVDFMTQVPDRIVVHQFEAVRRSDSPVTEEAIHLAPASTSTRL